MSVTGETDWFAGYRELSLDEAAARATAEGRPVRVLPPGTAMTMDWRPDRLNVELDDVGALVTMWPG